MFKKITDDILKFTVKYPSGMGEVNCYLIKGENGYTVIDTGTNEREAKQAWTKAIESGLRIEKVVLTHTHEDHIGSASWLQKEYGIPVIVSQLGYKEMLHRLKMTTEQFNQLITKYGGPELPADFRDDKSIFEFQPDAFFDKDEKIQLGNDYYDAIWTPGHAFDHFCFYNKEKRIMIVGDHILKDVSPVIGLWSGREENPLPKYLDSLESLKEYSVELALPGHGENINYFQDRINDLQNRHKTRLKQVYDSIRNSEKTAIEICREFYEDSNLLMNISTLMAILTRLFYLESYGKVERNVRDGMITFQAK